MIDQLARRASILVQEIEFRDQARRPDTGIGIRLRSGLAWFP